MSDIETAIIINAPLKKIWSTLTDFSSYKEWNPFIKNIRGKLELGERLTLTIQPSGKKPMVFKPKIISLINEQVLEWRGGLLIPGLFEGQHKFLLTPLAENKVQLIHTEIFSGILKNLIFPRIKDSTQRGFEAMNLSFQQRCQKI